MQKSIVGNKARYRGSRKYYSTIGCILGSEEQADALAEASTSGWGTSIKLPYGGY